MAKQVITRMLDDLDPEQEATETVKFGLDGTQYEIDLSSEHAVDLRQSLEPFLSVATKVGRLQAAASTAGTGRGAAKVDREQSKAMRAWWVSASQAGMKLPNGSDLPAPSDRGRIPQSVTDLYHEHQGKLPSNTTASAPAAPPVEFKGGEADSSDNGEKKKTTKSGAKKAGQQPVAS